MDTVHSCWQQSSNRTCLGVARKTNAWMAEASACVAHTAKLLPTRRVLSLPLFHKTCSLSVDFSSSQLPDTHAPWTSCESLPGQEHPEHAQTVAPTQIRLSRECASNNDKQQCSTSTTDTLFTPSSCSMSTIPPAQVPGRCKRVLGGSHSTVCHASRGTHTQARLS